MAFITAEKIDAAIGGPLRNTLTDNNQGLLVRLINAADSRARSDCKQGGYTVNPSTYNVTPSFTEAPIEIEHASLGYFIKMTFPRRNLPMDDFAMYTEAGPSIAAGTLQPTGLSPDPGEGVGAVTVTSSDTSLSGSLPTQLSMENLKVY